jgi:hypothetical protein
LYKRKLAEANTKEKYLEQSIYCKVEGKDMVLCDSDGNTIDNTYVVDYKTDDYYELKVDATNTSNLSVRKLDKVEKNKIIDITTDDVEYNNGKVAIDLKDDNVELLKSNLKDSYTFANNKHEMCTIKLDSEKKLDEAALAAGATKKPQIIESNNEEFGSYKKYFAGDGRENL